MERLYLLKYGELSLKGENRHRFEKRLCDDIRRKLAGKEITDGAVAGGEHTGGAAPFQQAACKQVELYRRKGRIYLRCAEEARPQVERALSHTLGLIAFSQAIKTEKAAPALDEAACTLAEELLNPNSGVACLKAASPPSTWSKAPYPGETAGVRFKIEARRADKSFPLSSYQIACRLGDCLRARFPGLEVDLKRPDWVISVEIRESAYLYGPQKRAPGGLPLGSSGRGLLLLSGGIDSPVAGYLMGKRGLWIDAVYFHTPPFTSEKAKEKVESVARLLSEYLTGIGLYVVPFTELQVRIKQRAREEEVTLLMRACMMRIAEKIALKRGRVCLITGESLGQVASQTVGSLRFTGGVVGLPVFRPLIGFDKEEIIKLARQINTYETSILPYEDCCTLFRPKHPLINPDYERMLAALHSLDAEPMIEEAASRAELLRF